MIVGIGNDIIEIERIKGAIERHKERFLARTFTAREQEYCFRHKEAHRHFAGRFAAKEAVVKAMGTGFRDGIEFLDVEILNDPLGKPYVRLSPMLQERIGHVSIHLSISHCNEYAAAVAIMDSP